MVCTVYDFLKVIAQFLSYYKISPFILPFGPASGCSNLFLTNWSRIIWYVLCTTF
jgi:hypothetical protein